MTRGLIFHEILLYKNMGRKQLSLSAVNKMPNSSNFGIRSEQLSQERKTLKLMTSCCFLPFLDGLALSKKLCQDTACLQSLSRKNSSLMMSRTILEASLCVCVCVRVQKQTRKLYRKIYNVVVACNVHLTAALDFSLCKTSENVNYSNFLNVA